MTKLIKCKGCEKEVFKEAKSCPSCGKDQRNWFVRNKTNVALLTVSGLAIVTVIDYKKLESEVLANSLKTSNIVVEAKAEKLTNELPIEKAPSEEVVNENKEGKLEVEPKKDDSSIKNEKKDVVEKTKEETVKVETLNSSKEDESILKEEITYTFEEENAIRNAELLVEKQPYSYQNLIKQLIVEEFPKETAKLAVDSLSVDWKEQAVLSAEFHLIEKGYSEKGLTKLLLSEGYSQEEIDYALVKLGY